LSGRIDPADHNASLQSLIEGLECERDVHPHLGVFLDRWRATLAADARPADHRGSRRARLRGRLMVHHRGACENAEGDHRSPHASVDKFLKTEDGIACLRKLGAEPAGGPAEDMQRYVVAEIEKWGKVAKFAGIKPE
jgi:hypothetical protein